MLIVCRISYFPRNEVINYFVYIIFCEILGRNLGTFWNEIPFEMLQKVLWEVYLSCAFISGRVKRQKVGDRNRGCCDCGSVDE